MYPGPSEPDYGAFVATMCDAMERVGHEVERVVIDSRAHGALATPRKYLDLARRAVPAAKRADVIYGHYLFPTGAVAAVAGRLAKRPWVLTAHGGDVRNLANATVARMSTPGITGASAIIAVSRFLAEQLRATGIALPTVNVIDMGVDMNRFRPSDRAAARRAHGLPEDVPVILAVGGLNERKNPLRLLQAFRLIQARHPRARLVYVGAGPLEAALRAGIRLEGLEDSVILTGALPAASVADWMAACDLLALPSRVEPLGVVALEALASGRPVVATRIGGTAEVVGRAGLLVDPEDPRSIADGIAQVLARPPSVAQCRTAAEGHDVNRQARRVLDVLQSAVDRHRGGPVVA
jgi:glycosyltransferase involved in cell wall biosynthesis